METELDITSFNKKCAAAIQVRFSLKNKERIDNIDSLVGIPINKCFEKVMW